MGPAAPRLVFALLALSSIGPLAFAQETPQPTPDEAQPPAAEPPAAEPPAATPPGAEPPAAEPPAAEPPATEPPAAEPPKGEAVTPSERAAQHPTTTSWQDILVVPRRPVLKRHRIELMPTYNTTFSNPLNNPVTRHHGFGAQLNFYLSEVLFLGLEGTYYYREPFGPYSRYFLVGLDQRVLPSVNEYVWSAFLDFGYIPIHGKFTLFNGPILHWDFWIMGGVGVFQSNVIPRNPADSSFSNILIAGLLPGIGTRLWVNKWFAIDAYVKNYLFVDQLEPQQRTMGDCPPGLSFSQPSTCNTVSQFTWNIVFGLGVSFFLPPSFEYKTLR